MTIQPTYNHILLEFVPPLETVGVIQVPQTAQKQPDEAIIVATGPGLPDKPMQFQVGQRVLMRRYFDMSIVSNGKTYRMGIADDVVAVVSQPQLPEATQDATNVLPLNSQ